MKYQKIQTIYKRNPDNMKELLIGQFSLPEFEYLFYNQWHFTEKIDGTNIRIVWDGSDVKFYGRTDDAKIQSQLLNKLQLMFPVDLFIKTEMPPLIMFGEGYGARIQKGGGNYISNDVSFILFDVNISDMWLERKNVTDIAGRLGIKEVPFVGYGTLEDAINIVKKGFSSILAEGRILAEGLVCRPKVELLNRRGFRIITKIKHRDFY